MSNKNDEQESGDQEVIEIVDTTEPIDEKAELASALEKAKSDLLYLRAEFDNYRKNAIKERAEMFRYAGEKLAVDLIAVLDNFDLALKTELRADNMEAFKKGFDMVATELRNILQKNNIQEVNCEGKPFDPMMFEALSSEETDEVPAGHITRVFKKAYKLHDKVIRHGQVVIAKEKTKDN